MDLLRHWTVSPCPECGDIRMCQCGLAQCGHHGTRESVEAVPAEQLRGAVEKIDALRDALIPFAFIGRDSMAPLGLGAEYDEARRLLDLPPARGAV